MTAGPGAGRTPTLDGLRGIAVLAVVIEHAWPNVLPGGFAGVDVFFVLSGYLITGLLLRELTRTGTVDLVSFYARRIRRIIPAATVCVIGVAILFTAVLGVGYGRSFRIEALSAALSVSNFLFVSRATDYFAVDPSSSPFLHYWSLAVEEQFYLLWPTILLLLFGTGRFAARRAEARGATATGARLSRWLPISLAAGIAAVSFALTLVSSQTAAFFLLPHRAWELLVGGLLAWLQVAVVWRPRWWVPGLRWSLAVGGAAALALTFVLEFERWPGAVTALPVLGTVTLILGGTTIPGARWLSATWLRFFGRISYALYLWHWPILAAATLIALPAPAPPLWMTVLAVGLAIGAAIASTFVLEEPIRFTRSRWVTRFRALAAGGAFVALASVAVVVTTAPPSPLPASTGADPAPADGAELDVRPQVARARNDRERLVADLCYARTVDSEVPSCVYGAAATSDGGPVDAVPVGMPVVVLFGDSHAMHWFPAVDRWAADAGLALVPLTKSGCVAVDADVAVQDPSNIGRCNDWRVRAFARLAELRPVLTVVASSSDVGVSVDGDAFRPRVQPAPWIVPAARFLQRLQTTGGGTVVYIADVPRPGFSVPDCLAAHWRDLATCALPVAEAQPAFFMAAEVEMAQEAGSTLIDPTPWICSGGTCTWLLDGRIAYRDDHHLTASVSRLLARPLSPLLDAALDGAATTSPTPPP
ncbi:MAG TPA: acyltransferase family protein [Candidatus Limnocylindrales bacterium]|nr:acyltransferase family protein [Candidatus Limnocylindrales bacterium]